MGKAQDGGESRKRAEPGGSEHQGEGTAAVRSLFTADQLVELDLNDLLRFVAHEDAYAVEQTLRTAARQTREDGDAASADALTFNGGASP